MVVLVELSVPDAISPFLLICFALTTGLVVCLMAMCMITTSMILVYILNYRQITDEPFKKVWQNVCEPDWERSFWCFKAGVPCFLGSLCCLSWMKFSTQTDWADAISATTVTVLSVFTLLFWGCYVQTKYRSVTRDRDLEDEFEVESALNPNLDPNANLYRRWSACKSRSVPRWTSSTTSSSAASARRR